MRVFRILLLFIGLAALAVIAYYRIQEPNLETEIQTQPESARPPTTEKIEIYPLTAYFMIFTQGTQRDFSAKMYHNRSDVAYITKEGPNTITITRNSTWQEFFNSMPAPFKLTRECLTTGLGEIFCKSGFNKLSFYLNGHLAEDALDQRIKDKDRLLITYGNPPSSELESQLAKLEKLK